MNHATKDDLKDVIDFLASTLPFSALPPNDQLDLARQLEVEYIPHRANKNVPIDACVFIIRTGAFKIIDHDGQLIDKLSEGECFGLSTQLGKASKQQASDNPAQLNVYAIEDSLVFRLQKEDFLRLLNQHASINKFFNKLVGYRENRALDSGSKSKLDLQYTQSVESIIQHAAIFCKPTDSIQEAAKTMSQHKVSCLILIANNQLHGIVTDRDLRNRVVAEGLDVKLPVSTVATQSPSTIAWDATVMEAQLQMSNLRIHHLPVIKNNLVWGVITATDIVRVHSVSIIHFVDRIMREKDSGVLAEMQYEIPNLLDYWIQADVSPQKMGESLSVIGDAFVGKAIELALSKHGAAPMDYAWLAFGSQARKDQSFSSDQDNGLILEREPTESEEQYFQEFTHSICSYLDSFGYAYCPGNIMASNPLHRKTVEQWNAKFKHWISTPDPEALLGASIFFDLRIVCGPDHYLLAIKKALLISLDDGDLFFMLLTKNALNTKPPLGLFRQFIVNEKGEHEHQLDIKHSGISLINDIARIISLAEFKTDAGTVQRIQNTNDILLQRPIKESLVEAWLMLHDLKLETQSSQLKTNAEANNYIDPNALSPLRRSTLKQAFKAIERAQKALAMHYLRGVGV